MCASIHMNLDVYELRIVPIQHDAKSLKMSLVSNPKRDRGSHNSIGYHERRAGFPLTLLANTEGSRPQSLVSNCYTISSC